MDPNETNQALEDAMAAPEAAPAPEQPKHSNPVGPMIGAAIIIILLIAGAAYYWQQQKTLVPNGYTGTQGATSTSDSQATGVSTAAGVTITPSVSQ